MSLIKQNQNKLFPSTNNGLKTFFNTDDFFNTNFFKEDALLPAMNVKEHDDGFDIEFAAPGFLKEDFEVTIDDNVLNVCGEKEEESEESEDNYTRKEFSYNSFKRSLKLPSAVNTDQNVKATYKNGILKLNLKKVAAKEVAKKVIKVQ
jgi:HSP20 family protein